MHNLYLRLQGIVRRVDSGHTPVNALSTGERLAALLVLDRVGALHDERHTALSAVDRIGTEWTQAAIAVQRDGWRVSGTDLEVARG